jgi:hypothetical protein
MRTANPKQITRWGFHAGVVAASLLVVRAWAGPGGAATGARVEDASADAAARVLPNYALEERFLPDAVNKLVFDLAVTPHWFSESDRFWYSYQTTEGTRYYVVDPLKRAKNPLWDKAKVAAELSRLTNFPYDAQHRRCDLRWRFGRTPWCRMNRKKKRARRTSRSKAKKER